MKKNSIKKNMLYNTLYQILIVLIPFITTPYISRVLGAEKIGIYSYTLSIETYFALFAALGTATYGTREIARVRNNLKKRTKTFLEVEILSFITSIICIAIWGIVIILNSKYQIYYLILTLNLINVLFDISWFYAGLEEFKYIITHNLIFKITGVFLIFIMIKNTSDLPIYMAIMGLSTLFGSISMWIHLPKYIKKINLKELKIKKHFKETLTYFIPTIAVSIYTVLDKTLIGFITKDNHEIGYYEQATKIIDVLKALTYSSLNTVMGVRISYLFSVNNISEIKNRIKISMNYILIIGFGVMFGLIYIAKLFVPIFFGDGFTKVSYLIMIMSPLIIIIGISNCLGSQYYNPAGLRKKSAIFILIGAVINLFFNILLIPKFKSYGAVFGTIVAEVTISYLYLRNCNDYYNFKSLIKDSIKKIISGLCMFIMLYTINIFNNNLILYLFSKLIIGVIIYFTCLFLLKDKGLFELINILKKEKINEK